MSILQKGNIIRLFTRSVACLALSLEKNRFAGRHASISIHCALFLRWISQLDMALPLSHILHYWCCASWAKTSIRLYILSPTFFLFKFLYCHKWRTYFLTEWNDMWCIDQYEMVLLAVVQAKRRCPYFESHTKWRGFNTGMSGVSFMHFS